MSDDLIELQTQLAFQEQTIAELNEALVSQQKQLDSLRHEFSLLQQKFGELEVHMDTALPANEKPPHY